MILIDSVYVNEGGGKVLLDYLVECIEKNKINCFYLFDERCINNYNFIPNDRKLYLKASIIKRHVFYRENKNKFSKVLCFGNLPPTMKLNIPVYTYFHQPLFLDIPKSVSVFNKLKIKLKTMVLNAIKLNTNVWLVQFDRIKKRLASKYDIDLENIKLMPFYPPLKKEENSYIRRKDGFVYISNGGIHKNHTSLINAFCKYFDENQKGVLHLTISSSFPGLIQLINKKKNEGYPITNHGFIKRNDLVEVYQTNEYLIFPSLAESFGLGLVEAIENGCKVIGADLPYTYAVCNPSILFDPLDVEDIKRAMVDSQSDNIKATKQLVFNQIDELIVLLIEK